MAHTSSRRSFGGIPRQNSRSNEPSSAWSPTTRAVPWRRSSRRSMHGQLYRLAPRVVRVGGVGPRLTSSTPGSPIARGPWWAQASGNPDRPRRGHRRGLRRDFHPLRGVRHRLPRGGRAGLWQPLRLSDRRLGRHRGRALVSPGERWAEIPLNRIPSSNPAEPSPRVQLSVVPILGTRRGLTLVASF